MKKLFITIIGILPMFLFAQEVNFSKDFEVKMGTPYKVIDALTKHYYEINNELITIKTEKQKVYIQKIDGESMIEISRKEFEDFPKKMEPRYTSQVGSKLYYFFTVFDKKNKKENFYVREIDVAKGSFKKEKLLFSTSDKVLPSTIKNVYMVLTQNSSDYSFDSSYDDERYLIQYRVKPTLVRDKLNHDVLGFQVFDKEFNKIWSNEVKMPHTEKEMNNVAYTVGKKGNVYMIAYIEKTSSYEFFEITEETKVIKPVAIKLDGNLFFNTISMHEKKDGTIACMGYYANGVEFKYNFGGGLHTSMNINGITQFTLNPEGDLMMDNRIEFPVEFINLYENNRARDKNEKREADGKLGIRDLVLRSWYEYDDGSSLIVGEQFFSEYQYNPMSSSGKTLHHYYEDVIATKIDKDGNVIWMKKLPKEQERTPSDWNWRDDARGGLSIKHVSNEDYHYILFLDNVKNIDLPMDEKPVRHIDRKGGYLTAYKIDDDSGEVEKLSILNIKDVNGKEIYQFNTSRMILSEKNELFLEVYIKGKKDALIKISL